MIAQSIQRGFERSFGTACFLAYFALLFFRHTRDMVDAHLPYAALAGVALVALFAIGAHTADFLDRFGPGRLSLAASILCCTGLALLEFAPGPGPYVGGGVLAIAGSSAYFFVLGKNLAFYNHQERICLLATAFIAGAVLVGIIASMADAASFIGALLLPAISALHLCTLKPNKGSFTFADLATTRKSHRFSLTVLLTTALTGLVWGIALALVAKPAGLEPGPALGFALSLALGGAIALLDALKFEKMTENSLLKWFATVAFVLIAPLPFVPDEAIGAFGACLFLAFSVDAIVCFSAMGEVARFNQISPYWVFGTSLAHYFLGAFVGFLSFDAAFEDGSLAPKLVACFTTLLAVIWCSDFVFRDNYPSNESLADMVEASKSLSKNESKPALWQRKIDRVIEEYELTARQQEVFRMLVRGRNAQYIAESFVISNSTAKAHIHNIYCKLNVHSQQELINLVEFVELPDPDNSTS